MANSWWKTLNPWNKTQSSKTAVGEPGVAPAGTVSLPIEQRSAAAIMRIKNLELRAKVIVEGMMSGLHRSPYHGFSVEFTDYRPYSPGDDLRYLDWKLLARGDRYYIKRYEDETNARCHLLLDLSGSMAYGAPAMNAKVTVDSNTQPAAWSKAEYAKTLVAAFTWFFHGQRDAVGVTLFQQQIVEQIPARFRPGQMRRIMAALEKAQPAAETNVAAPIDQLLRAVSKRGMIFLVSDLLTDVEQWRSGLGYLRSQGHDMMVLRILDPSEMSFNFRDPMYFHDLETQRELYIDPELVGADYRRRFSEHAATIQTCCDQLGIDLMTITTDKPLDEMLLAIVQRSQTRGNRKLDTRSRSLTSANSDANRGGRG